MTAGLAFRLALSTYVVVLGVCAVSLPARVPLHFGVGGDADRWGSRTEALLVLGGTGVLVALVIGLPAALAHRMPLDLVNVPHKAWWTATEERRTEMRRRLPTDLYVVGAATLVLLSGLALLMLRASQLPEPRLDGWAWVLLGVYVLVVAAWSAYALLVRWRPGGPSEGGPTTAVGG